MAVIKAKPEKIVQFFLAMMERELDVAMLTTRVGDDFFNGSKNDTVTMRVGGLRAFARDYEWRTRTAPIVMDDIEGEDGIPVKLDTHIYHATPMTDEHLTLDEVDLAREMLAPQVEAVVSRIQNKVVAGVLAGNFKRSFEASVATDPHLIAVEARRRLSADKVAPKAGRFWLIGSDVEAAWLASDRLSKYESTGQEGTPALRDAIIGRLVGVPVIVNEMLPADFAYFGHRSAFVLGNVAPVAPRGATLTRAGVSRNGFATRWIMDYDPNFLRDRSVVNSFMGLTSVNDERQLTGDRAGDLLPEDDEDRGVYNVRGLRVTFTDLDADFSVLPTVDDGGGEGGGGEGGGA